MDFLFLWLICLHKYHHPILALLLKLNRIISETFIIVQYNYNDYYTTILLEDRVLMSIDKDYYIYAEPFIVMLYLIFTFLSVQIWFLWKDIDMSELNLKSIFNDSFFTRSCIYVYCFIMFFFVHGFSYGTAVPDIYFKTLEVLTLFGLVLFTYDWYSVLEQCATRRSLPQELVDLRCVLKKD